MDDLRYPIGKFRFPESVDPAELEGMIQSIEETPARLREAIDGLSPSQLDTPYRPEGWTLRQVVHHVPDSHLNAYVRCKLAVTEDNPTIKPFEESDWAELADAKQAEVDDSLALLEALHRRWVSFLRALGPDELKRIFQHPEMGSIRVDQNIALYAWHGRHHVGHITATRAREGW